MVRLIRPLAMIVLGVISFVMIRQRNKQKSFEAPEVDVENLPKNAEQHGDWRIRQAALRLTAQDENSEKLLKLLNGLNDSDEDVRRTALSLLIEIGDDAVGGLLRVLKSSGMEARTLAAEALGEIGNADALDGLAAALQDESMWVRAAAAEALGALGENAIDALAEAMKDEDLDVRRAASQSLRAIGTERAMQALSPDQNE
jgi:HEAT repeat protein